MQSFMYHMGFIKNNCISDIFSVLCRYMLDIFPFFQSLGKDDNWSVFILGAIVLVALAYLIFKKN